MAPSCGRLSNVARVSDSNDNLTKLVSVYLFMTSMRLELCNAFGVSKVASCVAFVLCCPVIFTVGWAKRVDTRIVYPFAHEAIVILQSEEGYCDPNPCRNGAECYNVRDSYFCKCTDKYTGENCTELKDQCKDGDCEGMGFRLSFPIRKPTGICTR